MTDFDGKICNCGTRMDWKKDVVINDVSYYHWVCSSCGRTVTDNWYLKYLERFLNE